MVEGKIAVVTGGVGWAIAIVMAEVGANAVVADIGVSLSDERVRLAGSI